MNPLLNNIEIYYDYPLAYLNLKRKSYSSFQFGKLSASLCAYFAQLCGKISLNAENRRVSLQRIAKS
jgi:hypothetical protein